MPRPSKELMLQMYRKMMEIRQFEEAASELYQRGELPGFLHLYIGEEATAVGVCSNLNDDDYITSTHRGHGHFIAKGGKRDRMMAELFAKTTGYCKGKGGSMHIADVSLGILGANGVVGAGIPMANGAALSAKMQGTKKVAVAFFGDGATNQGVFHESLNLAAVWELPEILVCENNQYGMGTPQREHQKVTDISIRAESYGMPGIRVDGNNIFEVYDATYEAVERARNGGGPTLIDCNTYRFRGHHIGDPGTSYRDRTEVEEWQKRDPIAYLKKVLVEEESVAETDLEAIDQELRDDLEAAIDFARSSPSPRPEDALEDLYAGGIRP
ncbi:MAG: pyruvate dehydrogenase (acetyl-transferring) E1 component subunit alpha [Candidatus Poribacteria bacterium]|nr:pyruvate dehydrogenase (acetyl-transferring) E1 component subunit alpha [Candidatus Poribacteria bacterium]